MEIFSKMLQFLKLVICSLKCKHKGGGEAANAFFKINLTKIVEVCQFCLSSCMSCL